MSALPVIRSFMYRKKLHKSTNIIDAFLISLLLRLERLGHVHGSIFQRQFLAIAKQQLVDEDLRL